MSRPPSGYTMAEGLRDELLACPQEDWLARLREDPRFLNPELLELLVEACQTALPAEPYRAFWLSKLAVEVARLLAEQSISPEGVEMLGRALCLGGHACRLLGDHGGAEALLENAGFLAQGHAARGFFCRSLSLLRWDQGRVEEAAALLHQAGRHYEKLGDTKEEAACLALLGLLYTEEEEFDLAERLLRKARRGIVDQLWPWLAAQTHLALALCLARTDKPGEARRLRQCAWALSSEMREEKTRYSLLWREAQVAEALGDLTAAGQLFDSVRLKHIEQGRLPEAALVSVQLEICLRRQGRGEEARGFARELVAAFEGRPGLKFSLAALRCLSQEEPTGKRLKAESWSSLSPGFLLAFRERGEFPQPMPFV